MLALDPTYKSLHFRTFLTVLPPSGALGSRSQTREAVAGNVDSWKGRLHTRNGLSLLRFLVSTQMKYVQIMVSIHVSVKHCSFWNICNICRVLSAHAVVWAWTGNGRTDSPRNRFFASLATRMFPHPWLKKAFFYILTIAPLLMVENIALAVHFTDPVSNRCQQTIFNR